MKRDSERVKSSDRSLRMEKERDSLTRRETPPPRRPFERGEQLTCC